MQTNEIQELLLDTIPAWHMSKLVDRLVDGGFAERLSDPDDRRIIRLRATEKAEEYIQSFFEKDAAEYRAFFEQLAPDERGRFCAALRTIHDTFDDQRRRMIEEGILPPFPPRKGEKCQ